MTKYNWQNIIIYSQVIKIASAIYNDLSSLGLCLLLVTCMPDVLCAIFIYTN